MGVYFGCILQIVFFFSSCDLPYDTSQSKWQVSRMWYTFSVSELSTGAKTCTLVLDSASYMCEGRPFQGVCFLGVGRWTMSGVFVFLTVISLLRVAFDFTWLYVFVLSGITFSMCFRNAPNHSRLTHSLVFVVFFIFIFCLFSTRTRWKLINNPT